MTQTFQEMKKERETFTLNPFKLLTGHLITRIPEQISEEKSVAKDVPRAKKDVLTIPAEFAERFSSEVVRPQQQKKLAEIASVHKSKFMKESQYLRQRFSKELEETEKMEQNVSQVTRLTSRLAQILAVQSEQVGEMHGKTASATNIVKQTEEELLLAVRRSESSQTYMSLLIVGLALLLLVIDYFTP